MQLDASRRACHWRFLGVSDCAVFVAVDDETLVGGERRNVSMWQLIARRRTPLQDRPAADCQDTGARRKLSLHAARKPRRDRADSFVAEIGAVARPFDRCFMFGHDRGSLFVVGDLWFRTHRLAVGRRRTRRGSVVHLQISSLQPSSGLREAMFNRPESRSPAASEWR